MHTQIIKNFLLFFFTVYKNERKKQILMMKKEKKRLLQKKYIFNIDDTDVNKISISKKETWQI